MLEGYKRLFETLNKESISYCVYKGLNHLGADLDGLRGDIDMLVDKSHFKRFDEIARANGLRRVLRRSGSFPVYYLGADFEVGRLLFLDVETSIRLGHKPARPFRHDVKVSDLKAETVNYGAPVRILAGDDYFPLMFAMRVTAVDPKSADLQELKEITRDWEEKDMRGILFSHLTNWCKETPKAMIRNVQAAGSWVTLQRRYKTCIVRGVSCAGGRIKGHVVIWWNRLIGRFLGYLKARVGVPPYRVRRRGFLFAFIGVDGAGKSSLIQHLMDQPYFRVTGIRRVYFGNNEYWIPGIVRLSKTTSNIPLIRNIVALIRNFDRQARLLKALWYVHLGNVVLCDRYYYDDQLVRYRYTNGGIDRLKRMYNTIVQPKMFVRPDITFFLDVDPQVAFSRKQDYPYERVRTTVDNYRQLLVGKAEVAVVNANRPEALVRNTVLESLCKMGV